MVGQLQSAERPRAPSCLGSVVIQSFTEVSVSLYKNTAYDWTLHFDIIICQAGTKETKEEYTKGKDSQKCYPGKFPIALNIL